MPERPTALERRILGHLPEWVPDEAAFVAAHPTVIRELSLEDLTAKLEDDAECRYLFGDVKRALATHETAYMLDLALEQGLVVYEDRDGVRYWRKTQAGREALEVPETPEVHAYPGPLPEAQPAELKLHPAKMDAAAFGGVG